MGIGELVGLLSLSSWCLVIVVWLFLTMSRVCLQFVVVVFPDHTHYFERERERGRGEREQAKVDLKAFKHAENSIEKLGTRNKSQTEIKT